MKKKANRSKKEKALRIIATVMGVVGVIVIALVCIHQVWVKPPQVVDPSLNDPPSPEAPKTEETIEETPLPTDTEKAEPTPETGEEEQREQIASNRQEGVYTILLVGNDDGQGNTDTILVGKIDTVQHKMDFVTIPRDTLINMPWPVRKINCVYWGSRYDNGDGITALKKQISRLTGFEPDCYVVVDLNVFIDAVDLIGGVYFDVPIDMNYEMPAQNLSIHLKKGYQLLNGEQAMGCVRFRKGYPNGDLGRIETQHKFLSACASQFLDAGNIPHMPELLKLLADNLDTDLTVANLTFFAEEFLKCKAEDIKFYTPELGGEWRCQSADHTAEGSPVERMAAPGKAGQRARKAALLHPGGTVHQIVLPYQVLPALPGRRRNTGHRRAEGDGVPDGIPGPAGRQRDPRPVKTRDP